MVREEHKVTEEEVRDMYVCSLETIIEDMESKLIEIWELSKPPFCVPSKINEINNIAHCTLLSAGYKMVIVKE